MSERDERDGLSEAAKCEHYWAWVSPAGAATFALLCTRCHQPDPEWLNETAAAIARAEAAEAEVRDLLDVHDASRELLARAEAAEAKVAAVEVVLREITDAGQDALVGGFPEVRARIRAVLGVYDD